MSTKPRKRLAWGLLAAAAVLIVWQGSIVYQNQSRLQEAEQRLDLALWGSDNGLFDWSVPSGNQSWAEMPVWYSAHFKELLGLKQIAGLPANGASFLECIREEDRPDVLHAMTMAVQTRTGCDVVFQAQHKDGTYHWYTMRGRFSHNGHGRLSGTVLDITPRMKERQRADLIILSSPEAVITCDDHRRITTFNPAAEEMFGVKAEEMLGQPVDKIVTEPYRTRHDEVFAKAVERLRAQKDNWMVRSGVIEGDGKNVKTGEVFPVVLCVRGIKYRGEMEFIARITKAAPAPQAPEPRSSMPLPEPPMPQFQMPRPKAWLNKK